MKRRKNLFVLVLLSCMLLGTVSATAAVASYSYTLSTEQKAYTSSYYRKSVSGNAYVACQNTNHTLASINVAMINSAHIQKSSTYSIQGVGQVFIPYYSGVGVGEYIGLMVQNPASNGVSSLSVSGVYTP